jgi:hypothetical protein
MNELVYLHRVTLGLYPVAVYGPREVLVIDPEWIPPVPDDPNNPEMVEAPLVWGANKECQLPPAEELIELSAEEYELLKGAAGVGKVIGLSDGRPVLLDPPPPSPEVLKANELAWRNVALSQTESLIARHRDELDAAVNPTLTAAQFQALQQYRLLIRAWPEEALFPDVSARPVPPEWLDAQL